MSTPNTSATGGYLLPTTSSAPPTPLTLTEFIQTVLVGISGLPASLVRPRFQMNPPKMPDLYVNWLGFQITQANPDTYGYVGGTSDGSQFTLRHEDLTIQCAIYGPDSFDLGGVIIDGFQIPQNLEALNSCGMGFTSTGVLNNIPDLVNERWVQKQELEILLRREIRRTYSVLSFLSARGTITADTTPPVTLNWGV